MVSGLAMPENVSANARFVVYTYVSTSDFGNSVVTTVAAGLATGAGDAETFTAGVVDAVAAAASGCGPEK